MKKNILSIFIILLLPLSIFAQSSDDDFFFEEDMIQIEDDVQAKTDLSKGILFETGSIKIGGSFTTSLETSTKVYSQEDSSFLDNLKDTKLKPTLSANISLDARPSQTLRMYSKFGLAYPFVQSSYLSCVEILPIKNTNPSDFTDKIDVPFYDWFNLKELFTDFSIKDTAFFRFGLHTVTWGTGYFFSPVSDMINTSVINPENPTEQVMGSLNLRSQIVFPNSQNCLWFYIIPSTDFVNTNTQSYAKDTALAGKFDLVLGNWELGFGGFYKYQNAPKFMLTASGSLKGFSIFAEGVYSYGANTQWQTNKNWQDKTSIYQATLGLSKYWKDQNILFAAQYYYDSNNKDIEHQYFTYGHNIALMANFGRLFNTTDFTANVFGMVNFGKEELPPILKAMVDSLGVEAYLNTFTLSTMLNYSPINDLKIGFGPYITWESFKNKPIISLNLSFTLGGGKF